MRKNIEERKLKDHKGNFLDLKVFTVIGHSYEERDHLFDYYRRNDIGENKGINSKNVTKRI